MAQLSTGQAAAQTVARRLQNQGPGERLTQSSLLQFFNQGKLGKQGGLKTDSAL